MEKRKKILPFTLAIFCLGILGHQQVILRMMEVAVINL